MDYFIWRSTPGHTLSSVLRDIAQNPGCRVTVVCYEDFNLNYASLKMELNITIPYN
jgi:hypothetical protein